MMLKSVKFSFSFLACAFWLGHCFLVLAVSCSGIGLQCQVVIPTAEVGFLQGALALANHSTQRELPGIERCKDAVKLALIATGSKVMESTFSCFSNQ